MTTKHQYLDLYPISKESEKLIVGTIHPHDFENFPVPFFYGNVLSIWTILSDAFPDELSQPITLEKILVFLKNRKISISDTIKTCRRINPTALDDDLIPLELNHRIKEDIENSNISEILFTSGFGKNNAFKLFYENILGLKITAEIKEKREVTLPKEVFGRPVKLIVLYSPSGASNIGISKSRLYLQNKDKYKGSKKPVYAFKVDYYRQMFT
jgi:hypothetical protein